jgi:hypothetical protein
MAKLRIDYWSRLLGIYHTNKGWLYEWYELFQDIDIAADDSVLSNFLMDSVMARISFTV